MFAPVDSMEIFLRHPPTDSSSRDPFVELSVRLSSHHIVAKQLPAIEI